MISSFGTSFETSEEKATAEMKPKMGQAKKRALADQPKTRGRNRQRRDGGKENRDSSQPDLELSVYEPMDMGDSDIVLAADTRG